MHEQSVFGNLSKRHTLSTIKCKEYGREVTSKELPSGEVSKEYV